MDYAAREKAGEFRDAVREFDAAGRPRRHPPYPGAEREWRDGGEARWGLGEGEGMIRREE